TAKLLPTADTPRASPWTKTMCCGSLETFPSNVRHRYCVRASRPIRHCVSLVSSLVTRSPWSVWVAWVTWQSNSPRRWAQRLLCSVIRQANARMRCASVQTISSSPATRRHSRKTPDVLTSFGQEDGTRCPYERSSTRCLSRTTTTPILIYYAATACCCWWVYIIGYRLTWPH